VETSADMVHLGEDWPFSSTYIPNLGELYWVDVFTQNNCYEQAVGKVLTNPTTSAAQGLTRRVL